MATAKGTSKTPTQIVRSFTRGTEVYHPGDKLPQLSAAEIERLVRIGAIK